MQNKLKREALRGENPYTRPCATSKVQVDRKLNPARHDRLDLARLGSGRAILTGDLLTARSPRSDRSSRTGRERRRGPGASRRRRPTIVRMLRDRLDPRTLVNLDVRIATHQRLDLPATLFLTPRLGALDLFAVRGAVPVVDPLRAVDVVPVFDGSVELGELLLNTRNFFEVVGALGIGQLHDEASASLRTDRSDLLRRELGRNVLLRRGETVDT